MTSREQEINHMADASMRALDTPEGEEILQAMIDGTMEIPDGMAALLVLSGEFEYRPHYLL